MENSQIFLIAFGVFNLCLLIFCRQLSVLFLGFFSFGRTIFPPKVAEKKATKMGFKGVFSDPEILSPSRKKTIQFLAWSGGISFLGCAVLYIAIASGLFENQQELSNAAHTNPLPTSSRSGHTF